MHLTSSLSARVVLSPEPVSESEASEVFEVSEVSESEVSAVSESGG